MLSCVLLVWVELSCIELSCAGFYCVVLCLLCDWVVQRASAFTIMVKKTSQRRHRELGSEIQRSR